MITQAWLWSWLSDEQRAAAEKDMMLSGSPQLQALLERGERLLVRYSDGRFGVVRGLYAHDLAAGARLGGPQ